MAAMTATPGLCDGIQVIGAGLGRTGTKSLQAALDLLEYNRTYQHFPPPAHAETWARFAEGSASVDEVLDLVVRGGFTATCDQPMADLYAEQLRRFPDAVVVLTVRDSGERWAASWRTLMRFVEVQPGAVILAVVYTPHSCSGCRSCGHGRGCAV